VNWVSWTDVITVWCHFAVKWCMSSFLISLFTFLALMILLHIFILFCDNFCVYLHACMCMYEGAVCMC